MLCIGHRGAAGHAPENTLRSVRMALELGATWIEIDVYAVESQLIVFHDDTLERTTNGKGYLSEKSFAYLRSLDAGSGEKIPTLEEVLDAAEGRAGVNIELKGPETAELTAAEVGRRVRDKWTYEQFLVSSFDLPQLKEIKALDPKIRIGVLIDGSPAGYAEFAEALGAFSLNPSIDCVNRQLVADAHARGLKVFAYTANDPRDIEKMGRLGVDGVFSDYPERVLGRK